MEERNENKVWTDDKGITHIKVIRLVDYKDLSTLIDNLTAEAQAFQEKPKILVDINNIEDRAELSSSWFRKKAVKKAIDFVKDVGFKKVAVFGSKIEDRTVASFVISASRVNNIKIFKSKEEALKWLGEP